MAAEQSELPKPSEGVAAVSSDKPGEFAVRDKELATMLAIAWPALRFLGSPHVEVVGTWLASHLPAAQISELTALAEDVFGEHGTAVEWLREPNLATDNKAPIELLGSPDGFDRVKNLLLRIEYGVLA